MKKASLILVLMFILAVVVTFTLPFFIPAEKYKVIIIEKVHEMTGRDLKIGSDIKFTIFPNLGVVIENVSLSNASWASEKEMLKAKKMDVGVGLLPLISGAVSINKFVIDGAEINLEKNASGKGNWDFDALEKNAKAAPESESSNRKVVFGAIKITNARVSFKGEPKAQAILVSDLNAAINVRDLDSPIKINVDGKYQDKKFVVDFDSASLNKMQETKEAPVKLSFKYADAEGKYEGRVIAKDGVFSSNGKVEMDVKSMKDSFGVDAVKTVKLESDAAVSLKDKVTTVDLKNAKFSADDFKGNGNISVKSASEISFSGNVNIDSVNLNKMGEGSSLKVDEAPKGQFQWSSEPLDLSWIKKINGSLNAKIGELEVRKAKIKDINLALEAKNNQLSLTLKEVKLYGGTLSASADINAGGNVPAIRKKVTLVNINSEDFLKDFYDFDKLTGTANFNMDAEGSGNSQKEIVSSLHGSGKFSVTNGSIKGKNFVSMVRNIQSAFHPGIDTSTQKTDFTELSASFNIDSGIVRNNDLVLKAPLLRLSGNGTADLPRLTVNYTINPELVPTVQGQGATDAVAGLKVPVKVEGSLLDPKFRPDLAGMLREELKNPGQVKKQLQEFRGQVKDLIHNFKNPQAGGAGGADGAGNNNNPLGAALGGLGDLLKKK